MNFKKDYDFCGWAVIDNMVAWNGNGTVVKPGALVQQQYNKVPIILGKKYSDPDAVVGTALLESVDGGIYFYGTLSEPMLEKIHSGEIQTVSIYANNIIKDGNGNVVDGIIRLLELVEYASQPPEYRDTKIEKWKYHDTFYTRDENGLRKI